VARAVAALFAAAAFLGSGAFVISHPKNAAAPLQPPTAVRAATPSAPARASAKPTPTPRITLQPGVRATELPGITYTHVS
jgi:hypothetical protein